MFIATGFMVLGFAAAVFLVPETLPIISPHCEDMDEPDQSASQRDDSNESQSARKQRRARQWAIVAFMYGFFDWIRENPRTIPVILSFLFFQLGEQANGTLLLQYVAKET